MTATMAALPHFLNTIAFINPNPPAEDLTSPAKSVLSSA